jgi:UDP-2,4-diacetamido-2,4,6-trideoxy-beta-L-altropyranose hydrolase
MATAVFRADASITIGGGHVMRCLTLADVLSELGWSCNFACNAAASMVAPRLAEGRHGLKILGEDELSDPSALRRYWPKGVDLLAVDHYGLGAEYESGGREWARRVLAIEDRPNRRHDCDILLDQTPNREADEYKGLIHEGCKLLTGRMYGLLRPDFFGCRTDRAAPGSRGGIGRVLVSFGMVDATNLTIRALEAVKVSGLGCHVDVVLGAGAAHLAEISEYCETAPFSATLHIDTDDMAALMAAADIALGAAGSTSLERCAVALPTLAVIVADNQRDLAARLDALGAVIILGDDAKFDAREVGATLARLNGEGAALEEMALRAGQVCDGLGARRAALALSEQPLAKDGVVVRLRPAGLDDGDLMYIWQNEDSMRRHARNPEPPKRAEHNAWLAAKLDDPDCIFSIIEHGPVAVGVLRLDYSLSDGSYEVSILLTELAQGNGVGLAALMAAEALMPRECVLRAGVLLQNEVSARLFERAGYLRATDDGTEATYLLHPRMAAA